MRKRRINRRKSKVAFSDRVEVFEYEKPDNNQDDVIDDIIDDDDEYEVDEKSSFGEEEEIEDIKITPFNMEEEMDEGYFDRDGTFIFNKGKQTERDAWEMGLDNVQVYTLKEVDNKQIVEDKSLIDFDACCAGLAELVNESETVSGAIKRYCEATKKNISIDEKNVAEQNFKQTVELAQWLAENDDVGVFSMNKKKLLAKIKKNNT